MTNGGTMSAILNVDNSTLAISSNQLIVKAGGITTTQISSSAGITGGQIANTTITASNIAPSTITATQIASNANILGSMLLTNTDFPGAATTVDLKKIVVCNGADGTSLGIMRAYLNENDFISGGASCSATRTSAGEYTVTFNVAFSDVPSVVVTPAVNAGLTPVITTLNASSFSVVFENGSAVPTDTYWTFVAVGART
jgi:hypothetical protein